MILGMESFLTSNNPNQSSGSISTLPHSGNVTGANAIKNHFNEPNHLWLITKEIVVTF